MSKAIPSRPGNTFSSKSSRGARVCVGQNLIPRLQKHFGLLRGVFLFSVTVWFLFPYPERVKLLPGFMSRCQPGGYAQRNATTPSYAVNNTRAPTVNALWAVLPGLLLTVFQHTGNSLPSCLSTSLFSAPVAQLFSTKTSHIRVNHSTTPYELGLNHYCPSSVPAHSLITALPHCRAADLSLTQKFSTKWSSKAKTYMWSIHGNKRPSEAWWKTTAVIQSNGLDFPSKFIKLGSWSQWYDQNGIPFNHFDSLLSTND